MTSRKAASAIEYSVLAGLVAIGILAGVTQVGTGINAVLNTIGNSIQGAFGTQSSAPVSPYPFAASYGSWNYVHPGQETGESGWDNVFQSASGLDFGYYANSDANLDGSYTSSSQFAKAETAISNTSSINRWQLINTAATAITVPGPSGGSTGSFQMPSGFLANLYPQASGESNGFSIPDVSWMILTNSVSGFNNLTSNTSEMTSLTASCSQLGGTLQSSNNGTYYWKACQGVGTAASSYYQANTPAYFIGS